MTDAIRQRDSEQLRVLLCFGVTQAFFDADAETRTAVGQTIVRAYDDLGGRFGLTVLGTMDDDDLQVGASTTYPWTAYVLADAPDLEAVKQVTNVLREFEVGADRLWKYMKVEARVGRRLFFGND
ncbi:MAG TPA: hypothetical protein VLK58_07075 [Conexibacter sp.]|nr:hypothetical protein [Conexibacter sp.]